MKRKIEMLEVKILAKNKKEGDDDFDAREFSEFVILDKVFDYYYNDNINVKRDLKSNSIAFRLESRKELDNPSTSFIKLNFIKYNKATKVVDKNFEGEFKKNKDQGDLDNQHYICKTLEQTNTAIIVWESILGAVSKSTLQYEINKSFRKYIKSTYSDDKKKLNKLLTFEIKINHLPCVQFLEELNDLKKISLIKLDVSLDSIKLDPDIEYSGDDKLKESVTLSIGSIMGNFSKRTVIGYINKLKMPKAQRKVKKISISGIKDKSAITLDIDKIKFNKHIEVAEDIDGLVDTNDIEKRLKEELEHVLEVYTPDISIALDENEE